MNGKSKQNIMNQPIFKHTGSNPPTVFHPVGVSYQPVSIHKFNPISNYEILDSRPQHIQNKIPNHPNYRGQQAQSYIFPSQMPQADQNRTLKLQSFGRKVSAPEQNYTIQQIKFAPTARLNHSIERALDVRQAPSPYVSNFNPNKRPLFASQMLTNQQLSVDSNFKTQQINQIKKSVRFIQKQQNSANQMKGQMRLSLNGRQHTGNRKQSKTDRSDFIKDRTNYVSTIGNNLKYRQFPTAKNNITALDSTQSSQTKSMSRNNQANKQTLNNNFVQRPTSPINFWPLSISPYEQKKSFFPITNPINTQKTIDLKDKSQPNSQFKKKKPLQFLNQSKRKNAENIIKTFTLNDFQLLDKVGKGSFGDVYMAQQKRTGFLVVIKKLQKKKIFELKVQQHLLREIKIQCFLKHRHLTSFYGFFNDENYVYLILQLMPDGSIMQVKKKRKISESETASYIKQICQGLKYMHTEQIIHRDIKPENIFLNDGYAKIGDFGCSIFTQSLRNTVIGSLAYISPQQLKQGSYDEKIDVWSLGVMAYQMMVGKSPYEADIIKIAKNQIAPQLSELKFPPQIGLSAQAKDFLINMLHLDPNQRLGIAQALKHDFIRMNLAKQQNI